MRHVFLCPLRWSDMDSFGHVNNVVFLRYLEEARIDFMFRLAREAAPDGSDGSGPLQGADGTHGPAATSGEEGGDPPFTGGSVVARHEIDYLRPLVHRHEPVTIETWITKIGAASATIGYEIKDDDVRYVRASTVIVPFDLAAQRPRRLTDAERRFLERYVDDAAA